MSSLSARLLVSVSILLLFFFGATIVVLDSAFRSAGERAQQDILDGYLMSLLAAAEPAEDGTLAMPPDLPEPRFSNVESGLYAEIRGERGIVVWQSRSSLGLDIPAGVTPQGGDRIFAEEFLQDGTPLLTLSIAVYWEFPDGELRPFVFKVAENLDSFHAQVATFRRQLFGWFGAVALIMLLSIAFLMRRLLQPLRQVETEIGAIENGNRVALSDEYPTELQGVARNMNLLINSERARAERYRVTLDNLAHSLKTPLAALRALLVDHNRPGFAARADEQIERMDEIVRYQLRKPAAGGMGQVLGRIDVPAEIRKLADSMRKVHHDKQPAIEMDLQEPLLLRADTGDFLELAGNLIDNACKWCNSKVRVTARAPANNSGLQLIVADDGPGIPEQAAESLLQRGTRLDEKTPGHGIGLAIVNDIAQSYGGKITIAQSDLGGAEICVSIP